MGKCFSRASESSQPKRADRSCTVTRDTTSQDYGDSQEGIVQSPLRSQDQEENLGVAMATATQSQGHDGNQGVTGTSTSQMYLSDGQSTQTDGSDGHSTLPVGSEGQRTLDNITESQEPSTGTTSSPSQTDGSDSHSTLTDGSDGHSTLGNISEYQGPSARTTSSSLQTDGSESQEASTRTTSSSLQTDGSAGQRRQDNATEPQVLSTGNRSQYMVLSERFLVDLASQIDADWQLLFIRLGLTNAELEHIDYDRGFNQKTKNWKAFLLWRKKNKERQASEQLRILFEGFQESGRQDLVDKYTEYLDDVILISALESCGSSEHDGERFRKAFDNSTEYATLQCLFETVHEGVGMVCRRGTGIGTAFRVGSKYIMTAYHVFKSDIDDLWTFVFGRLEYDHSGVLSSKWDELAEALSVEKNNVVANTAASIKKTLLEDGLWYDGFRNVSKLTEALAAIIGSTETERLTERIKEFFNDGLNLKFNYTKEGKVSYLVDLDCNISFGSKRDDVLILELAEDRRNQQFPRSFKLQTYKLKSTDHIHLIGYPGGKVIQADLHCPLLMETDLKTIHKEKLKYWTETHKPKRYRLGEDDIEAGYKQVKERNDREFFLTSKSTLQGASGAPGFIVHKNVPVVLVMLVEAYPKFFWNLEGDHQKLTDPKSLVAAGIPMSKISQLLSEKNLIDLKEDIFKSIDKSTIGFIDTWIYSRKDGISNNC